MRTLCAAVAMLLVPWHASNAAAQPDFSKSEILVSSEAPLEAEVVTFTVVLRNTGTDDAGVTSLMVEWPLMGFFVDAAGFDAPQIDHAARTIEDAFPLARGGERRLSIRVLAPRDSGGDGLSLAYKAAHYASGTEYRDSRFITIDTRLPTGGIDLGGYRLTSAGLAVVAWLVVGGILWVVVKVMLPQPRSPSGLDSRSIGAAIVSRTGPGAAVFAVMIALGFWLIFAVMAWRDYESVTRWSATRCTILGGRLSAQTTRTGTRPGIDTTNYVPVLGLRYTVEGRETFSSGFDTGSRLGRGGQGGRTEELAGWAVGADVPCWYNPDDPLDVVVRPGFGAAYVFALFPIPVFLIGLAGLRHALARH